MNQDAGHNRSSDSGTTGKSHGNNILDNAGIAFALIDPASLRFVEFNRTAPASLGYSEDEFAAISFRDIQNEFNPGELADKLAEIMAAGHSDFHCRLRHKDGELHSVRLACRVAQSHSTLYFATIWDMNRRHGPGSTDAESPRAAPPPNTEFDFIDQINQEIRAPLNTLMGLINLSRLQPLDEIQTKHLGQMGEVTHQLLKMLDDLADYIELGTGRQPLKRQTHPPRQLLDIVRNQLASRAQKRSITIEIDTTAELPASLSVDPIRFGRILLALAGKAVQCAAESPIVLGVRRIGAGDDQLRFEIRYRCANRLNETVATATDAPAESVPPPTAFAHQETCTQSIFAIEQRLAAQMGGRIGIDNHPGAAVTLWFEANFTASAECPPLVTAPLKPVQAPGVPGRTHVLVAEDNPVIQEVLKTLLQTAGITVDIVGDGAQAVAKVEGNAYDLVFMDIQMPIMDGYAATRAIRRLPGRERLPIIALTASNRSEEHQQSLAAGMNEHLTKPIASNSLYTALERWVPGRKPPGKPRAEPAAAQASDALIERLRTIPGLNVEIGLKAVRDRKDVYLSILGHFADQHQHDVAAIAEARRQQRPGEARRLAHSLKGAAGTLGVEQVQQYAAALETAFATDPPPQSLDTLQSELEQVLAGTVTAIHKALIIV